MQDWEGKSYTVAAGVGRGSINRLVREALEAHQAGDEATSRRRTELANVISYNLAADLADCWPGDRPPLTEAHFEEGLKAAEDCIQWRDELMKGPGATSMAWWAKGMHLLSLGRHEEAVRSFHQSLTLAREIAQSDEDFGVVLGRGYTGLARWIAGEQAGRDEYREALGVFANQLMDEDHKDDARFGIDQLETVKLRYGPAVPA